MDDRQSLGIARDRFSEEIAQVIAIDHPRHEGARRIGMAAGAQPIDEMVGLIGQRAHPGRADVEEVARCGGAVSESLAGFGAPLDQDRARAVMPQQVDRQQRAGKATADDRNIGRCIR